MEKNKLLQRDMAIGMLSVIGRCLKRVSLLGVILGLITLNVLTLSSHAVHSLLYKGLSALPVTAYLHNSPMAKQQKLIQQNKTLKQKMASKKAASKKIAKRIAARTARATTTNVASVFTESIPVYGIAFIIATTAYEVTAACDNLKDMDQMLIELGVEEHQPETQEVCGQEVPSKQDVIQQLDLTKHQLAQLQDTLRQFVTNTADSSVDNWNAFKQHIKKLME